MPLVLFANDDSIINCSGCFNCCLVLFGMVLLYLLVALLCWIFDPTRDRGSITKDDEPS